MPRVCLQFVIVFFPDHTVFTILVKACCFSLLYSLIHVFGFVGVPVSLLASADPESFVRGGQSLTTFVVDEGREENKLKEMMCLRYS